MKIPHSKPYISKDDEEAVTSVIKSGMHARGERVIEFEDEIKKFLNMDYARATTSGTSALHLSLLALGVKEGDEVIIPSYVCQAVLNSVNYVNATPRLADLSPNFPEAGYNISYETISPLINKKTKAIILPHMFGFPADIEYIKTLNVPIIEDCAQSIGAECNKKKVGSMGNISIFSFYATKVISSGYGGMVVTSSEELKEKLEDLTKYDKRESYKKTYNYDMSDIQAALGLSQFKRLQDFIEKRKAIAKRYDSVFKDLFLLPNNKEGSFPFRYIIKLKDEQERANLMKKLKENDIIAETPIFKPLHRYLNLPLENFLFTENAHKRSLSLPIYPALNEEEIDYIIKKVNSVML